MHMSAQFYCRVIKVNEQMLIHYSSSDPLNSNDVVNPAAREIESSPIYGMPVIDVDRAKTVIVLKRSMAAGFAGVDNPLFVRENTRMLFGDAKATVQQLVTGFKES